MSIKTKILAVDDEEFNLDILEEYLSSSGYDCIAASNGNEALKALDAHSDIQLVVLDRMMPKPDGMEILQHMKSSERLKEIPVIMQTAAAAQEQILEGIRAGAYYYLTKPYQEPLLLGIVRTALADYQQKMELRQHIGEQKRTLGLLEHARFRFRTIAEARSVAFLVASCFPKPESVVLGITELCVNAIEHGNLGITYPEKTRLVLSASWDQEVERRLILPEHRKKYATLEYQHSPQKAEVTITDMGNGFDWEKYVELTPDRVTDPNGRGIALARMLSFDQIQYMQKGAQVVASVNL